MNIETSLPEKREPAGMVGLAQSAAARQGTVGSVNLHNLHDKTAILVVDDEKLIRLTVSAKLKKVGYVAVPVGSVDEAVEVLRGNCHSFGAVISDIMMGSMDGFVFRDIVRGMDRTMPFFFMTALDPEEGSGFLKRIVADPLSYYLPKSVSTEVLLKRVQQIVASRRVERFIERQIEESRQSLAIAAHIQRSMLPVRANMDVRGCYSAWWLPKEIVSGDMFEVIPFGQMARFYILGDIQGHGTSAALAMTAVQAYLKNLAHSTKAQGFGPVAIANLLQGFFRENLPDVSYMTALICLHDAEKSEVSWISCGAPDLIIDDDGFECRVAIDPSRKGGLPIGLLPDTIYTNADLVVNKLSPNAVCLAVTDGVFDMSRDEEGFEKIPGDLLHTLRRELLKDARVSGSMPIEPYKFMVVCKEYGYTHLQDDVTILMFGPKVEIEHMYRASLSLSPSIIDETSREIGAWCRREGWPDEDVGRVQLVFEEKLMNVHDHGFDEVDRIHEVAWVRLLRRGGIAELTVWDCGTQEPSLAVAAGSSDTAFELANRQMSNHGRGRLMLREMCDGIERKRYGELNETVYYVRLGQKENEEK